jgi:hypothetical protein
MKKLMFAFCFAFGGLVVVNAQDTTSTSTQQYPTTTSQDSQDQDRERINSRDLPDAIKRSLEGTEYRGWLVNAAYKTTGMDQSGMDQGMQSDSTSTSGSSTGSTTGSQGDQTGMQGDTTSVYGDNNTTGANGQEIYVVELKNGAQTKTVRFDKDGKQLDDQGMQDDQK